ncbi:MAG: DUF4416 family protein [Candidatus Omnitrophota bacterium]
MGKIGIPERIKIVAGFIFNDLAVFDRTIASISKKLGPVDHKSEIFDFDYTDYYEEEMGKGLKRSFVSFERLRRPDRVWELKNFTNKIETGSSHSGRRRINIDPGYLTLSKLVLLTTKDYAHRIYLGGGIYSEITLFYKDGSYRPWEWTYPDYATQDYISFFKSVRESYSNQAKAK